MPRLERHLRAHVCGSVEGSASASAPAGSVEGADARGGTELEVLRLERVRGASPVVVLLPGLMAVAGAAMLLRVGRERRQSVEQVLRVAQPPDENLAQQNEEFASPTRQVPSRRPWT